MNFGEALKYQREINEYSQNALAKAVGISQQNISNWEANKKEPSISHCIKLADFYGITLDELVGRDSRGGNSAKYHIGTLNNNGGNVDMK